MNTDDRVDSPRRYAEYRAIFDAHPPLATGGRARCGNCRAYWPCRPVINVLPILVVH